MKPFNLEEAKAGKPVCTRDGRSVRIICFDAKCGKYPIIALIQSRENPDVELIASYTISGHYVACSEYKDAEDLFMKSEPTYHPFDSAEEVMEAVKEHGDWLKHKEDGKVSKLISFNNLLVEIGLYVREMRYTVAFDLFTFADGTPFGKLVEE